MPKSVSKRQWRFMQSILHGKPRSGGRGTPPKSIAAKYSSPGKDAPEQHGSNSGGTWGEEHHKRHKEKTKAERTDKKKSKAKLRKSFEEFYKGMGTAVIVLNERGQVLVGKQSKHKEFTLPGGHVDPGETYEEGALRELREEAGIVGTNPAEIGAFSMNGNDNKIFVVDAWKGKIKDCEEVSGWSFMDPGAIPYEKMRPCATRALQLYYNGKLNKSSSLKDMLLLETLEKSVTSHKDNTIFEIANRDTLRLIGNSAFRWLREHVKDMQDEDFKDVELDNYVVHIRRHMNDVYSGRVQDGHKIVYQFTNQSLPNLTAALMSIFEWYLPEDESELELLDESKLSDDAIHGGINELIEDYKRNNISNIYHEMENIRSEIRNGMAVDLQQIEARMMKLFDRMEEFVQDMAKKHNHLADESGKDIDELEAKLLEIQRQVDDIGKKPEAVEAISSNIKNKDKILDDYYCYLSRPHIEVEPSGRIRIVFGSDWTPLEKENLLQDIKAKVVKKARS